MHDRIAKVKIVQGYVIGFIAGFIVALVVQANAHTPCDYTEYEHPCKYEMIIDIETGEAKSRYICD